MPAPTNTYGTLVIGGNPAAVGQREDLSDIIYDISPLETPFVNGIGRGKAEAVLHEVQMDKLAAAASAASPNAVAEGDDATLDIAAPTQRLQNRTQLMDKAIGISSTLEAVIKAGRKSEVAYQIRKRSKELKRDIEGQFCQNPVLTAAGTDPRKAAGYETWIGPNTEDKAGDGAATAGLSATVNQPNTAVTRTDGTQRALLESMLKNTIQLCWVQGGEPERIIAGPVNKQKISGFAGNATRTIDARKAELQTAVEVYKSDFGVHTVMPSRFNRERTVLVVDTEYWSVDYLQPFKIEDLAKTGHSTKKMISVECTLSAKNPNSSGGVFDLTTT